MNTFLFDSLRLGRKKAFTKHIKVSAETEIGANIVKNSISLIRCQANDSSEQYKMKIKIVEKS